MRFIHIADVHLGVQPDKGKPWSEQRGREVIENFDRILALAEEQQIDLLLIAGDLFHHPPGVTELSELDYKLSKLSHTRTVIIAGNHDHMAPGSAYETYHFKSRTVCLSAKHRETVYIPELHTCIQGQSFSGQEIRQGIYDDAVPGEREQHPIWILLAHGGDATHAPINRQRLLDAGFDYIALGHIHKPEIIRQDRMAYAGSVTPIDYTDVGDRGYIYGEILPAEENRANADGHPWQCHIRWQKMDQSTYINLALTLKPEYSSTQIMDTLAAQMSKMGEENIYRILLRGQKAESLALDFYGLEHRYRISAVEDQTQDALDVEQVLLENQDNLIGQFIMQLQDKEDDVSKKALSYGLAALFNSSGPLT